jgi:hypothetical protein
MNGSTGEELTLADPEREPVQVVPARRTVVTALPLTASARERLARLLDARVIDIRTECVDADLVLSPSSSPQLIGKLKARYPSARIIVAELEDWEFDIDLTGPVTRLLRGGADGYVVADSLDDLARKLSAPPSPVTAEEHSMPRELHAATSIDDLVAAFLRQTEREPSDVEQRRDP